MRQLVRVVPALARGLAHAFVAQVGEVGIVHLHVVAASVGQRLQLRGVGARDVVVEDGVELGIGLAADAGAPATEVQHRRRRDRDLGPQPRAAQRLDPGPQVLEVGELDVLDVTHLVDDADRRRCELLGTVGLLHGDGDVGLDAAELLEEVEVEIGAPELAVGDGLQADVGLEAHDLVDRAVLDLAQLRGRDLAAGLLLTRLQQVSRTEEAADVVGAERRRGAYGHGDRWCWSGRRTAQLGAVRGEEAAGNPGAIRSAGSIQQ